MKISVFIGSSIISFVLGASVVYFWGGALLAENFLYRDSVNNMKGRALTYLLLQREQKNEAMEFLQGAIDLDKIELSNFDMARLSKETNEQIDMLNSIYSEITNESGR